MAVKSKKQPSHAFPQIHETTISYSDDEAWAPNAKSMTALRKALALLVDKDHIGRACEAATNAAHRFTVTTRMLQTGESRKSVKAYLATLRDQLATFLESSKFLRTTFNFGLSAPDRAYAMLSRMDEGFFPAFPISEVVLGIGGNTAELEALRSRELAMEKLETWAYNKLCTVNAALEKFKRPGQRDHDANHAFALSTDREWAWLKKEHGARGDKAAFFEAVRELLVANDHNPTELEALLNMVKRHKRAKK